MPRSLSPAKDEAILAAAIDVLLSDGYGGLRMEEVADRATVSKRTLYKRYANKEALIAAAAAQLFSRLRSALPAAPPGGRSVAIALGEFAIGAVDFFLDPVISGVLRVVISESHRQPALGAAFVENGKTPIERQLAGFLAGYPGLKVEKPELAAAEFLGMLKEVAVWPDLLAPGRKQSVGSRRAAIKSVVETFVRAYAEGRAAPNSEG